MRLEAALALGRLELGDPDPAPGRGRIAEVREDAVNRGYARIALRAGQALDQASKAQAARH